eukprot:scaffold37189_cov31-Tisochrysis_lutea.AAC.5
MTKTAEPTCGISLYNTEFLCAPKNARYELVGVARARPLVQRRARCEQRRARVGLRKEGLGELPYVRLGVHNVLEKGVGLAQFKATGKKTTATASIFLSACSEAGERRSLRNWRTPPTTTTRLHSVRKDQKPKWSQSTTVPACVRAPEQPLASHSHGPCRSCPHSLSWHLILPSGSGRCGPIWKQWTSGRSPSCARMECIQRHESALLDRGPLRVVACTALLHHRTELPLFAERVGKRPRLRPELEEALQRAEVMEDVAEGQKGGLVGEGDVRKVGPSDHGIVGLLALILLLVHVPMLDAQAVGLRLEFVVHNLVVALVVAERLGVKGFDLQCVVLEDGRSAVVGERDAGDLRRGGRKIRQDWTAYV